MAPRASTERNRVRRGPARSSHAPQVSRSSGWVGSPAARSARRRRCVCRAGTDRPRSPSLGLAGVPGAVQGGIQPVAAAVPREDPAGAVRAVGCRREPDDEHLGVGVAEPRAGPAPVGLVREGGAPALGRDRLAPPHESPTGPAHRTRGRRALRRPLPRPRAGAPALRCGRPACQPSPGRRPPRARRDGGGEGVSCHRVGQRHAHGRAPGAAGGPGVPGAPAPGWPGRSRGRGERGRCRTRVRDGWCGQAADTGEAEGEEGREHHDDPQPISAGADRGLGRRAGQDETERAEHQRAQGVVGAHPGQRCGRDLPLHGGLPEHGEEVEAHAQHERARDDQPQGRTAAEEEVGRGRPRSSGASPRGWGGGAGSASR